MKKPIAIFAAALTMACGGQKQTSGPQLFDPAGFSATVDGKPVSLYTLTNNGGMAVQLTNYGARIVDVWVPAADGSFKDVVMGFENIDGYLGAADINNDIHQQGILEKHVEGLKTKFGVAMADLVENDKMIAIAGRSPREKQEISLRNLAIIIENRLREIIGFVVEEIGDSGYAGRLKGGIVLTGGGSQLTGIDDLFREATGMEVRLALPDVAVADDEKSLSLAQNPAHATVIGLLLKAFADDKASGGVTLTPGGVGGGVRQPATHVKSDSKDERKKEKPEKPEKKSWGWGRKIKDKFDKLLDEPLEGDEDF